MRVTLLLALAVATACGGATPITRTPPDAPTREEYVESLRDFGLGSAAVGQDWIRAGEHALSSPIAAAMPFSETGYFSPTTPAAVGYRLTLRRGRKLIVEVTFESSQPTQLFLDLFQVPPAESDDPPERVAEVDPGSRRLEFDVRRDGDYILRLQPELLRGGRYTIVERTENSLLFPVQGHSLRVAQSSFGAPRDAGRRSHQGIDLFAPRGTPVVAAAPGVVRVDTNTLGGNVIWLRDTTTTARRSLYYAHLDGWAVENGARVERGDVIGFVGNTGNARTTPPHLHFGIYERGATDPYPYLQPPDPLPAKITADLDQLGDWARIRRDRVVLRSLPGTRGATTTPLTANTTVTVVAATGSYLRVVLPDGTIGYVTSADIASLDTPVRRTRAATAVALHEAPSTTSPRITTLEAGASIEVLGSFQGFDFVRTPTAALGWIAAL